MSRVNRHQYTAHSAVRTRPVSPRWFLSRPQQLPPAAESESDSNSDSTDNSDSSDSEQDRAREELLQKQREQQARQQAQIEVEKQRLENERRQKLERAREEKKEAEEKKKQALKAQKAAKLKEQKEQKEREDEERRLKEAQEAQERAEREEREAEQKRLADQKRADQAAARKKAAADKAEKKRLQQQEKKLKKAEEARAKAAAEAKAAEAAKEAAAKAAAAKAAAETETETMEDEEEGDEEGDEDEQEEGDEEDEDDSDDDAPLVKKKSKKKKKKKKRKKEKKSKKKKDKEKKKEKEKRKKSKSSSDSDNEMVHDSSDESEAKASTKPALKRAAEDSPEVTGASTNSTKRPRLETTRLRIPLKPATLLSKPNHKTHQPDQTDHKAKEELIQTSKKPMLDVPSDPASPNMPALEVSPSSKAPATSRAHRATESTSSNLKARLDELHNEARSLKAQAANLQVPAKSLLWVRAGLCWLKRPILAEKENYEESNDSRYQQVADWFTGTIKMMEEKAKTLSKIHKLHLDVLLSISYKCRAISNARCVVSAIGSLKEAQLHDLEEAIQGSASSEDIKFSGSQLADMKSLLAKVNTLGEAEMRWSKSQRLLESAINSNALGSGVSVAHNDLPRTLEHAVPSDVVKHAEELLRLLSDEITVTTDS
mmetsp:Transcript_42662/g.83652  ORF Transcript_42662/g.83652 Transcript_42662/m.83652 type:complete len:657 (+) Transcript_42662:88-2058(+)|eukprot:CAMPEP_0175153338 /NCGR_PEP_ID=MMETSP0087-20121206/19678_1 /TAXON_ID=136419 /ORGANISM="Unknown Unknown, Strain D1" /LENGTH=656 /DNA_ID=CAMNT_0016439999 /DNA_START=94 /DNA_END=2064 /DNA_ORIENTATION=-